eukprot:GHVP01029482.1.p1 GENE.GHVP01029482.1~~GHVP01029482.1.p1  ORF type:complete len:290 (+),score=52.58 GHVP01029482.1:31-870(+)
MEVKGLVDQINSAFTDLSLPQRSELTFGEELFQERIAIEAEPQFHVVSTGIKIDTGDQSKIYWRSCLPIMKKMFWSKNGLEKCLHQKIRYLWKNSTQKKEKAQLDIQIHDGTRRPCIPEYKAGETNFYFQYPFVTRGRIYFFIGVNCSWSDAGRTVIVPDEGKEDAEDHVAFQLTSMIRGSPTKEILKLLFTTCVSLPNPPMHRPLHIPEEYIDRDNIQYECPVFERFYKIYNEIIQKTGNLELALEGLLRSYGKLQLKAHVSVVPSYQESTDDEKGFT